MTLYEEIKEAVEAIIAKYQELAKDGLTFTEMWTLFNNAMATLVQVVEKYTEYDGAEKKAAVLAALEQLYDEVIEPIDLKSIPNFLEPIVDKALKETLLVLAGPAIDALVNIFNKGGWNTPDDVF